MLYFTICPNSASDAIDPSSMLPWHLAVQKSTDYGNYIYTKEQGTIKMFWPIVAPEYWRKEQINFESSDAQVRYTYGTEQMLIKNCLFYRPEEYTKEFLEGRFTNDLNGMLKNLSDFEEGVLWLALLSVRNALSPYLSQPILSHKDLLRISGKVGAIAHNTENAISLQCRLVEATGNGTAHQGLRNRPDLLRTGNDHQPLHRTDHTADRHEPLRCSKHLRSKGRPRYQTELAVHNHTDRGPLPVHLRAAADQLPAQPHSRTGINYDLPGICDILLLLFP